MTTTTGPVTVLRQPVERIDCAEQALRTIQLDPNPRLPVTAYANGYLAGALAGDRLCFDYFTGADRVARDDAYATGLRPLPLPVALEKHYAPEVMGTVGWLAGFREATVSAAGALECSVCARRLFEDLDSVHRCLRDLEWLCASPSMSCFRGVCVGAAHDECHEESI